MSVTRDDAGFIAEVLRINARFVQEIVEGFDICPYARGARLDGSAIREVLLDDTLDLAPSLALIDRLERDPSAPDIVQVIYPRLSVTSREFEHFNARVRDAHVARVPAAVFVHAVFHPDYACDLRTPDALVPYLRRSPDPMIQLVRFATLENVRKAHGRGTVLWDLSTIDLDDPPPPPPPSVPDRIALANRERVLRVGAATLEAIHVSIREDRARAYARFE